MPSSRSKGPGGKILSSAFILPIDFCLPSRYNIVYLKRGSQTMTYTIMIDEEQRVFLMEALSKLPSSEFATELIDLFAELPAVEEKDPGCIHGFCL